MKTVSLKTSRHNEFIEITDEVRTFLRDESLYDGFVVVFVPHTTAGVTINECADPDVQRDILTALERVVPKNAGYHHAEGNSDAHIKASLMGSSVTIPVEKGELLLGTWQGIFFCEFDGPRRREFSLKKS